MLIAPSSDLLPALRIGGVKIPVLAACHGGTAAAPGQQFTFGAFLKFPIVPIALHLADPHVGDPISKDISNLTVLHPAAGENISRGQDGQVAVAAVASAVDCAVFRSFRDFERAGLIFIQGPEVIFLLK